jgi:hypothetical protein
MRILDRQRASQRGSTTVGFLVLFIPFCVLFCVLYQLALAGIARGAVEYAAFAAVRAAVVWLPREEPGSGGTPRTAAAFAVAGVSPPIDEGSITLVDDLGGGHAIDLFDDKARYAKRATAVVLSPEEPGWNELVTADVYYLFPCHVPGGKLLLCSPFADLPRATQRLFDPPFPGRYLVFHARHRLPNQGRP